MKNEFTKEKTGLLLLLYQKADWGMGPMFACTAGCAACCTRNLTITSLEGKLILAYLEDENRLDALAELLAECQGFSMLMPTMTTNAYARFCLEKKVVQEEKPVWNPASCIFLKQDRCSIYPVRPYGCRGFASMSDCRKTGSAELPQPIITLNIIVQQIIEHLSQGEAWGSVTAVLTDLLGQQGEVKKAEAPGSGTLPAEALPGFLLDPEDRPRLQKHLSRIMTALEEYCAERKEFAEKYGINKEYLFPEKAL